MNENDKPVADLLENYNSDTTQNFLKDVEEMNKTPYPEKAKILYKKCLPYTQSALKTYNEESVIGKLYSWLHKLFLGTAPDEQTLKNINKKGPVKLESLINATNQYLATAPTDQTQDAEKLVNTVSNIIRIHKQALNLKKQVSPENNAKDTSHRITALYKNALSEIKELMPKETSL